MENDPEVRSIILTRIRMIEEAKVKEAEGKIQEERLTWKTMQRTSWLAKKKEITARALARKRGRTEVDEVKEYELVSGGVKEQGDSFMDDMEEHRYLDIILAEIGVVPIEVKDDNDWETAAHDNLEECVRVKDGHKDKDIKDDIMKTYLTSDQH